MGVDPSGQNEAQLLADIIANARLSTLQGAFRILGWPIVFTVVEAGEVEQGRRRDGVTGQHLRDVAGAYRQAVRDGRPPTRTVADRFGASHSTAARWVGMARTQGYLGAAKAGRAGGEQGANQ